MENIIQLHRTSAQKSLQSYCIQIVTTDRVRESELNYTEEFLSLLFHLIYEF